MSDDIELKYSFNKMPVCPHCDYEWDWDGDLLKNMGARDEIKTDCPTCGKPIVIVPDFEVTYSTRKDEAEAKEKA